MSNSAGIPSTLCRLKLAIYGAAQNIASETLDVNITASNLMPYFPVGIKEIKKKKRMKIE